MRVRSVVGRNAQRSAARLGTEEEAVVEDLGMLEQVDESTWESQDDEECEKAKQNEIDMKYEDGGFDRLRRGGHGGRTDVLLSQTKARRTFWLGHEGTMRRAKIAVKESKNQVGARPRKKNSRRPSPVKYEAGSVCVRRVLVIPVHRWGNFTIIIW